MDVSVGLELYAMNVGRHTKFVNRLTVFKIKIKLVKTNDGCVDNDYVLDDINMIL